MAADPLSGRSYKLGNDSYYRLPHLLRLIPDQRTVNVTAIRAPPLDRAMSTSGIDAGGSTDRSFARDRSAARGCSQRHVRERVSGPLDRG